MVKFENQCCGCDADAYPCIGASCPYYEVKTYVCDCCGEEVRQGELYQFDGEELCIDCIKDRLEKVY